MSHDSNHKNYAIYLKFGTNVHLLNKISRIDFKMNSASESYAEAHKRLPIEDCHRTYF